MLHTMPYCLAISRFNTSRNRGKSPSLTSTTPGSKASIFIPSPRTSLFATRPNANPNLFPIVSLPSSAVVLAVTPTTRKTDREGTRQAITRPDWTRRARPRSSSALTSQSQVASFVSARGCSKKARLGPSRRVVMRKERRFLMALFSMIDWPVERIVRWRCFPLGRFVKSRSTLTISLRWLRWSYLSMESRALQNRVTHSAFISPSLCRNRSLGSSFPSSLGVIFSFPLPSSIETNVASII